MPRLAAGANPKYRKHRASGKQSSLPLAVTTNLARTALLPATGGTTGYCRMDCWWPNATGQCK
jgi:hypothetical protein